MNPLFLKIGVLPNAFGYETILSVAEVHFA